MTKALVLSGGGTRSAAHIGVLAALSQPPVEWVPDLVVGTSGGGLVAGLWAAGWTPQQMTQFATQVTSADVHIDWRNLCHPLHIEGLLTVEPLFRRIYTILGGRRLSDFSRKVGIVAFNASAGRLDLFTNATLTPSVVQRLGVLGVHPVTDAFLVDAMRATMAVPALFKPHVVFGNTYIDGGVGDNFPLDIAEALGATLCIGVNLGGQLTPLGSQARHLIALVTDAIWSLLDEATEARQRDAQGPSYILRPNVAGFAQTDLHAIPNIIHAGFMEALSHTIELNQVLRQTA